MNFYFILQQVLQNYLFRVHTSVIKSDTQIYFLKQLSIFILNKSPTRCNSMQSDLFHCKVTLHVSGDTVIRSTKNCNRSLRYWS